MSRASLFVFFLIFTGCFSGEESGDSSGGLFVNHKQTDPVVENIFTLTAPLDDSYNESEFIDIILTHEANVDVTGNPRVAFDLGGVTNYADYLTGTGSKNLIFRYDIQGGDTDSDGIEISALIDLNGGLLKYSDNGTISNTILSFDTIATPSVLIDTTAPEVNSVAVPADGDYKIAAALDFTLNTSENVTVSGSPRIILDIDGVSKNAQYLAGSGTSTLVFRYIVVTSELDMDGINFSSTLIDLNGGSLLDSAGNAIDLDMEAVLGVPSLALVNVDGVIPTVVITAYSDITAANHTTYSISGTCSENGQDVALNLGSVAKTVSCSANAFTSDSTDVSSVADTATFVLTANHGDAATNVAIESSITVDKDTALPQVEITSAADMDASNHTDYNVSGTCSENGQVVDVNIGVLNYLPNCSSGTWSTGNIDVSSLTDGTISITADHSSIVPLNAIQATLDVDKDVAGPVVTISSASSITSANETSYKISGTCSENTRDVPVAIGALSFTPVCSGGSWTTGNQDVSALTDGPIIITADHSNIVPEAATQASITVTKNTATPVVTTLSVASTLRNTADLNWNLTTPGGFTIDDYVVNYRAEGSPTWLLFSDGVSTDVNATVESLIASTTYEFRVAVKYDSSEQSDWSNTAVGTTKPDDALFDSPYKAMNVGGATDTKVVALYDGTIVKLNGVDIAASPLSRGEVAQIVTTQFDIIEGDKAIYTAGRRGSGSAIAKANITWSPSAWAGKEFNFNATRYNPQQLHIYAAEATTVTVKQGATTIKTQVIAAGVGMTISWSVYGSFQVNSTGTILAFHTSGSLPTQLVDPKPLLPSSFEIIGVPSNSMRITSDKDSTNYDFIHSNSVSTSSSLDKTDSITVNAQGTGSYYQGDSLIITADRKISGASYADSNGGCAAPFLPTNLMKKKYAINAAADYVAFASKEAGTIDVYDSSDTLIETLTLARTGANPNAPYKARRATTAEGYRFFATVPVAAWYQPNSDAGSGDEDETILYGSDE